MFVPAEAGRIKFATTEVGAKNAIVIAEAIIDHTSRSLNEYITNNRATSFEAHPRKRGQLISATRHGILVLYPEGFEPKIHHLLLPT